jgi:hypothetical protein
VRRQVENVLAVTVTEIGEMEKEKPRMVLFNVISVEIVDTGLANRQFYQGISTIGVIVKYALS